MPFIVSPGMTMAEIEEQHIRETVKFCNGSKEKAAKMLGIAIQTIYNKFEKWDEQDALRKKLDADDLAQRRKANPIAEQGDKIVDGNVPHVTNPK